MLGEVLVTCHYNTIRDDAELLAVPIGRAVSIVPVSVESGSRVVILVPLSDV